jgi:hypothetical protein
MTTNGEAAARAKRLLTRVSNAKAVFNGVDPVKDARQRYGAPLRPKTHDASNDLSLDKSINLTLIVHFDGIEIGKAGAQVGIGSRSGHLGTGRMLPD